MIIFWIPSISRTVHYFELIFLDFSYYDETYPTTQFQPRIFLIWFFRICPAIGHKFNKTVISRERQRMGTNSFRVFLRAVQLTLMSAEGAHALAHVSAENAHAHAHERSRAWAFLFLEYLKIRTPWSFLLIRVTPLMCKSALVLRSTWIWTPFNCLMIEFIPLTLMSAIDAHMSAHERERELYSPSFSSLIESYLWPKYERDWRVTLGDVPSSVDVYLSLNIVQWYTKIDKRFVRDGKYLILKEPFPYCLEIYTMHSTILSST